MFARQNETIFLFALIPELKKVHKGMYSHGKLLTSQTYILIGLRKSLERCKCRLGGECSTRLNAVFNENSKLPCRDQDAQEANERGRPEWDLPVYEVVKPDRSINQRLRVTTEQAVDRSRILRCGSIYW